MVRRQAHGDGLMVVAVDFSGGPRPPLPFHRHPHEQVTYVATGRFHFTIGDGEGQTVDLVEPGDLVVVPPGAPHTVELLSKAGRLIDSFHPIREEFL
jgi:quercetin dioxygenase-like cupin family protein